MGPPGFLYIDQACECEDCNIVRASWLNLYRLYDRRPLLDDLSLEKLAACSTSLDLLKKLHKEHKPWLYTEANDTTDEDVAWDVNVDQTALNTEVDVPKASDPNDNKEVSSNVPHPKGISAVLTSSTASPMAARRWEIHGVRSLHLAWTHL